ncbi:amino acid ABC transporter membrane protein, PAAT family [Desulfacinum hydrothermale DSM 13146]|uniref:Putative glutamine transport system permease protein GlnP n=1 Tax=Desulfacinum hydrothermale DSM 13146 TaxID=1121390 RepID=A0A1W1XT37_9BACT|nr:amino acid ABC transporter permease [Desulfacinum hydrothermale]SMC27123.1 amino acid ABC transporter membrane protein, PAAT family [Desulfacinum hydrothermale DSM 13146]
MAQATKQLSRRSYFFWATVFFLGIFSLMALLYFATRKVDYVWRWYRVPQYFYYKDKVEVRSQIEGQVEKIVAGQKANVVVVTGPDGSEEYQIPGKDIRVGEGDYIYPGDILGVHQKWKVGILLQGLWLTLKVSLISIIFGILIGLIVGLARISANPALKWSAITYIELIRGSPLLVQIFIWYFVLGTVINTLLAKNGMAQLPPLWFGVASLAVFAGAYVAEIVRAGIQSIHRGQMEAARSLGMTYPQAMRHVILPQAFRRILPPLAGQFISLIKDSSLLGIIAIRELTKATREVVTTSLQPFELWFVCALLYLVLTFGLSMFVQYLERRTVVS